MYSAHAQYYRVSLSLNMLSPPSGQLMCEFKHATFSGPVRRGHQQDSSEKDLSLLLQEALESAVRMVSFSLL